MHWFRFWLSLQIAAIFLCSSFSTVTLVWFCLAIAITPSVAFILYLVLYRSGFASRFPTTNKFLSGVGAAFTCLETAFRLDALHRQMKLLGEDNPVSKLQVKLEPGIAFGWSCCTENFWILMLEYRPKRTNFYISFIKEGKNKYWFVNQSKSK